MTEDERAAARAEMEHLSHYAVAMHLSATKRVGAVWLILLFVGSAAAWRWHSWWFLVAAVALGAVAFQYLMTSCARHVQRETGLSYRTQSEMSLLYKANSAFKREVDAAIVAAKARVEE